MGNGSKWIKGGKLPSCPYCQDDGKPCQRCGTGIKDWVDPRSTRGYGLPGFADGGAKSLMISNPDPTVAKPGGIAPASVRAKGQQSLTVQVPGERPTTFYGDRGPEDRPKVQHYQGGTVYSHAKPPCGANGKGHDGSYTPFAVRSGEVSIYPAQGHKLANASPQALSHLDLILDLAGLVKDPRRFILHGPRRFTNLNQETGPEVLRFDWPDMTAPTTVRLAFWQRLLALLPARVAIACVGGHGRTGTAIACLMVADGMEPDVAIAKVRSEHCQRAIETAGQEAYIRSLASQRRQTTDDTAKS